MSRARFALLFTLILGLVLSSCRSLHLEAAFSQPEELTATAQAAATLAAPPPTDNALGLAAPTVPPTTATPPIIWPAASPVPTMVPTPTTQPTASPAPTTAPSRTAVPAASPAPSSSLAPAWQLRWCGLDHDSLRSVADVAWSADGEMLAVADPKGVHSINRQTLQEEYLLESGVRVTQVAYSRDGRLLATSTCSNTVQLWDVAGRQRLQTLEDASRNGLCSINSLAISPDGTMLAASIRRFSHGGGSVWLWRTDTGERPATWSMCIDSTEVKFSPDGTILAAPDCDVLGSVVKLWDTRTAQLLRSLKEENSASFQYMTDVAFHPGGRLIAGVGDGVYIWNVDTGETKQVLEQNGFATSATCVAYSPDGALIAVGYFRGEIRLWDGDSGELLHTLDGDVQVENVAFNPDGRTLASRNVDGTFCLWDLS